MRFVHDDRVRLLRVESGVPAGAEGTVLGFKHEAQVYLVQFANYGVHEVPEDSVDRVEAD
jgi:hypothetical protein